MTEALIYLGLGALYMFREFGLFLDDAGFADDDPAMLKLLYVVQLANHLFRMLAIWPSYLVEDFILWICRMHDDKDVEGPDAD
jgi:hypothetical protein